MRRYAWWVGVALCLGAAWAWWAQIGPASLAVAGALAVLALARRAPERGLLRPLSDLVLIVSPEGQIREANERACRVLGYERQELVGQPVDLVLVETTEQPRSFRNLETALRTREGERLPVLLSCSVVPEGLVLSAQDATEKRQLQALRAAPLVGVARLDSGGRLRDPSPHLVELLGARDGVRLDELVPETRGLLAGEAESFQLEVRAGERWVSLLVLPEEILVQDVTARRQAEEELQHARQRLQDLVDRLVVAREEERRSVARDLHDGLLQTVIAAEMCLGRSRYPEARSMLLQAVEEGRRLISDLRPASLEQFGLEATLRREVAELGEACGCPATLSVKLPPDLPAALETTLYRVAQEGLSNIRKHARPGRVAIQLRSTEDAVELEVRDWGAGFDPQAPASGVGLRGMRERVELAGGRLEVSTGPGEGTVIRTVLPLPGRGARP